MTKYAYIVRYRRAAWRYRQARFYRTEPPARRFIQYLLAGDPTLSPVVECRLEREPLGPAETVWQLDFEARL